MRYAVKYTTQFKKELEQAQKQHKDLDKLFTGCLFMNYLMTSWSLCCIEQEAIANYLTSNLRIFKKFQDAAGNLDKIVSHEPWAWSLEPMEEICLEQISS